MNTEHIETVFQEYLNAKTDYSIMINASWGRGKTYFWKHRLSAIAKNNSFRPIYISLNGISNYQQFEQVLFIQLIPIIGESENKNLKNGIKILNNILNLGSNFLVKSKISDLFKGVGLNAINYNKVILCFDDLERCQIKIQETLGIISDLVEHKGAKIIMIAHEKKISPQQDYNAIKEKVIGRILNFNLKTQDALPLLFEHFRDDNAYHDFLIKFETEINDILTEYNQSNLRIIKFFLDSLATIHAAIGNEKNVSDLIEIILFTAIISIEFKTGNRTSAHASNPEGINDVSHFYFEITHTRNLLVENGLDVPEIDEKEEEEYAKRFYLKYLHNRSRSYYFYFSIYKFILTGYFDSIQFQNELNNRHPKESPEEQALVLMTNYKFRELENETFEENYQIVLKAAREGKYSIYSYYKIAGFFHFFSKNGIIQESISTINNHLTEGLAIAKTQQTTDNSTFDNLFYFSAEGESANEIKEKIREIHQELTGRNKIESGKEFIKCLQGNDERILASHFEENAFLKDWFPNIDPSEFGKALLESSNKMIFNLSEQFHHRYNARKIGEFLYGDKEFLDNLSKFLINSRDNKIREPKKFLLNSLIDELESICKSLEDTRKK